jgi:hypothetical protein
MGEAWWSLANLKTVKLGPDDMAAMKQALADLEPEKESRQEDIFHLHFSLGKALEDAKDYAASFHHYDQGNRLRRTLVRHDADDFSAEAAEAACPGPARRSSNRSLPATARWKARWNCRK